MTKKPKPPSVRDLLTAVLADVREMQAALRAQAVKYEILAERQEKLVETNGMLCGNVDRLLKEKDNMMKMMGQLTVQKAQQ